MSIEKERKAFEDYFKTVWDGIDLIQTVGEACAFKLLDGKYIESIVEKHWRTWKASANREGYKLVPAEPTQEMLDKFPEVTYQDTYAGECSVWADDETIKLGYKAMIGAIE